MPGRPARAHHRRQGRLLPGGLAAQLQDYAAQIVANAKVLAASLADEGYRIISGGTDTHLMLVDVFSKGMLGSEAEKALGLAGITVNKNAIPFDMNPPMKPSGIRLGTPALTTRGMKEAEMKQVAHWIARALEQRNDSRAQEDSRRGLRILRKVPALLRAPQGAPATNSARIVSLFAKARLRPRLFCRCNQAHFRQIINQQAIVKVPSAAKAIGFRTRYND